MLKRILKSKSQGSKDKVKNLLFYLLRKRGAKKSWDRRHQKVLKQNYGYKEPCNTYVESKHQDLWSVFRNRVDMTTLRICKNISGQADERIIPEDIFVSDIEPTLTTEDSVHFLSHKSFYNRWFSNGIFPKDLLHCIDGQYMDAQLNRITADKFKALAKNISYPVVFKPNRNSYGGENIFFIKNTEELLSRCLENKNFVVQERILQYKFFKKFNPYGLNTIRVYVYQSVKDNSYHILNMALRMGKEGSLDNETSGGIHTMITQDGYLNNYAVDKYGTRYNKHPDSGYRFDQKIPALEKLKKISLKIAQQVFYARLLGLDVCYDKNEQWRVIELNTKGHTIRFSQYGGQPFFGEFTGEIIEFCKKNHWTLK